jgi:hypothetical protein
MALQAELAEASYARTVITVVPTRSGTEAVQFAAPTATPLSPVEVVHRTAATPVSSDADPEIVRTAADVVTLFRDGDAMRRVGALLSFDGAGGGDDGGGATGGASGGAIGG